MNDSRFTTADLSRAPGAPDSDPATLGQRPLSPGQAGITLQQQANPTSPIFNIPAALAIEGPLDQDALRLSLQRIVERHDVLRTIFPLLGPPTQQTVLPPGRVPITKHDLRHLPAAERWPAARDLLDDLASVPFDLGHEPGLRCALVTVSGTDHILFWMAHHIVFDGWSKSIFAEELSEFYSAHVTGRDPQMVQLKADFGDFSAEQHRTDRADDEELLFWEHQLRGSDAPLLDRPASRPDTGPRGGRVDLRLGSLVAHGLADLARRERASIFMTLHTCFAAVLHRATGSRDIILNTPFAGRQAAKYQPLIGFFANALPIRVRFAGDPTLNELLRQVRSTTLDALEHTETPPVRLAEHLRTRGLLDVATLTQASLAFANGRYRDVRLEGLRVERFPLTRTDVRYPLEMHLWPACDSNGEDDQGAGSGSDIDGVRAADDIAGQLAFRSDLIAPALAEQLAADFVALASALAHHPFLRLSGIPSSLTQSALPLLETSGPAKNPAQAEDSEPAAQRHSRQPSVLTDTERELTQIWASLLHTDDIDVSEPFTQIGGHSLLVALMMAQIRDVFGIDLPARTIYRAPTIRAISCEIDVLTGGLQATAREAAGGPVLGPPESGSASTPTNL